jgi:ABC-type transport system involved in cytochrome c biogenesis permease component
VFSGCLLILLPFAFGTAVLKRTDVSLGSLWIIHEFVAPELEMKALDLLLSSRSQRSAILMGKISFTAAQIFSLQIPITLFWIVLYHVPENIFFDILPTLIPVYFAFTLGTASLGALVFCLTVRSLARDILQPILFFPLQSALLLASVSLSVGSISTNLIGAFSNTAWWTILLSYPVLLITLGCLLSPILFQE